MSLTAIFPTAPILALLGALMNQKGMRRLLHKAITNAIRVAGHSSIIFARAIVPEKTGALMESGISFLTASLMAATGGVNLKSVYTLPIDWPVSYARHVSLLPQSSTNWTKPGSRADYQTQIHDFIIRNFSIQLAVEIAKLRN